LSKATLQFIKTKPYMVNVHHVDKFRNRDEIVQIIASQKVVEHWYGNKVHKGITERKFWKKFWGWGILDWMSLTLNKFSGAGGVSFPPESGIDEASSSIEIEYLDNALGEPIESKKATMLCWKEVVVENYNMYSRSYLVLDE